MSSAQNPPGSGDDVVGFEELPELTGDGEGGDQGSSQGGDAGAGAPPAEVLYQKDSKTYKCPPGYKWDAEKKACAKVKKEMDGPDTVDLVEVSEDELIAAARDKYECPAGQEWDKKSGKCVPVKKAADGPGTCKAGEVWDADKKKCVPTEEALRGKDATIEDLKGRLESVENQLRMKKIETRVDEQIQSGHIAPVQRDKVINFAAGLPDEKLDDLTGIFKHQKFPIGEESGSLESKPPGEATVDKIGESESIEKMSEEDKAELKKRFGIDELESEKGVRKAS